MLSQPMRFILMLILFATALLAPAIPQGAGYASAAKRLPSPQAYIAGPPNATAISAPAVELAGSFGGALETIGEALHLHVVGDLIYVADTRGGLLILRVHPERFPEPMFLPTIAH